MFETHLTRTYDVAFARARAERAATFRALLGFGRSRTASARRGDCHA